MMVAVSHFTRAVLYVLLAELFWKKKKDCVWSAASFSMIILLMVVEYISTTVPNQIVSIMLPLEIMCALEIYGIICLHDKISTLQLWVGVIEAYIGSFLLNLAFGILFGILTGLVSYEIHINGKYTFVGILRIVIIYIIWKKYDWLQLQAEKLVMNIIIIVGSFFIFFRQLLQMIYVDKDYNLGVVLLLLIYLTMIFTAFMLLQHNRLTAKQQAIEEDNRQMSQRLHRSKDVLGVVSQVVASEDHIDPKLRKELADFCDDEMNEMQDRTLGVNLIGDTGIELVNVMLQKQMMRCADLNISFDVMIPAPVDGYIQNIGISVTEFMRMLNDLLKNAVKAILSSENAPRELLLIMGDAGADCFEIRLYDSGVPFPPVILEHMGERGNTTDGTGNGLADTIETLGHYHASFAIESIEPGTDIYTKCVHIAFDGRGCGA